jgi:hypothetical protein
MRLADHGVARHAAQLVGDLAGGHTLAPEFLQALDSLVRPRHYVTIPQQLSRLAGHSVCD